MHDCSEGKVCEDERSEQRCTCILVWDIQEKKKSNDCKAARDGDSFPIFFSLFRKVI